MISVCKISLEKPVPFGPLAVPASGSRLPYQAYKYRGEEAVQGGKYFPMKTKIDSDPRSIIIALREESMDWYRMKFRHHTGAHLHSCAERGSRLQQE